MSDSRLKVLAINGCTHDDLQLASLLRCILTELAALGLSTEQMDLANKEIHNCLGCHECSSRRDRHCVQTSDAGNAIIEAMAQADAILFAYSACDAAISPGMQALMDRSCMVSKANDQMFRRKVGAAITSLHCAGAVHTFDTLNHFFLINEMIVPGSTYWPTGIASSIPGTDPESDSLAAMRALAKNIAWLLSATRQQPSAPSLEEILAP